MERAGINLSATPTGNTVDNAVNAVAPTGSSFTGPRGSSTTNNGPRNVDLDLSKAPSGRNPRGAPNAAPQEPDQFFKNLQFLGGVEGAGQPLQGSPDDRQASGENAAARRAEGLELIRELNKTDDPETRELLRGMIKSLGPFEEAVPNYSGGLAEALNDKGPNTKSGQPEPGIEQPDYNLLKAADDTLNPLSPLAKAVVSGNPQDIATEMGYLGIALTPPGKILKELRKKFGKDMDARMERAGKSIIDWLSKGDNDVLIRKAVDDNNIVNFPGNSRPATLNNQQGNVTSLEGRRIADEIDAAKSVENIPGNSTSGQFSSAVKADNLITERAINLNQRMTPVEIGRRIDQLKDFINVSSSPEAITSFKEEMKTLERARELIKLRTVK